jgi:hypothetical protein
MNTTRLPVRQRGFVSIFAAILLLAGILLVLARTYDVIGSHSVDNAQQLDTTTALTLAESGLQRAQALITENAADWTSANCTGSFFGSGPFPLGPNGGSFSYGTSVSNPATCGGAGQPICVSCTVSSIGRYRNASRELNLAFTMASVNGTTGRGQTVTMVLRNTYSVPAIGVFNLAWQRQEPGGNADASVCGNGCVTDWNVESSSGFNSVGGMGITVDIAALTSSKKIVQTISAARYYTEVGGLFPSISTTDTATVTGSYWKDSGAANSGTAGPSGSSSGETNSGVATSAGTCTVSPATHGTNREQLCTRWCQGADTLVFGLSGRSPTANLADQVTSVVFNTSGTAGTNGLQNIAMTRLVHFVDDPTLPEAHGKVYSEIWWTYNPWFMAPATGSVPAGSLGATSYPMQLLATVGSVFTPSPIPNNATQMTLTAGSFSSTDKLCIGDEIATSSPNRFPGGTLITGTPDNATGAPTGQQCSNRAGVYTFSNQTTGAVNSSVTARSRFLVVKELWGTIALNTALRRAGAATTLIPTAAQTTPGDTNIWTLSTTTQVGLQNYVQGASGTTITFPTGTTLPAAGTRLAVYSGFGQFAAGTTVVNQPSATTITVSQAPGTGIESSAVCGGTCAMFSDPSSTSTRTQFQVTKSAGTSQWSGGFACLKNVDPTKVGVVTSSSVAQKTWLEKIQ